MDGLERRLVCIVCPKGCRLRARQEEGRWYIHLRIQRRKRQAGETA